jgi:hypothetical protein
VVDAILGLVARRRPLLFIGMPGVGLMILGVLTGVHVVQLVDQHHVVPFGTAILSTLLVIGGLLLSVTGVILNSLEHFMGRLTDEIRSALGQSRVAAELPDD